MADTTMQKPLSYYGYIDLYLNLLFSDNTTAAAKYSVDFSDPTGVKSLMDDVPDMFKKLYKEQFGKNLAACEYISREDYDTITASNAILYSSTANIDGRDITFTHLGKIDSKE